MNSVSRRRWIVALAIAAGSIRAHGQQAAPGPAPKGTGMILGQAVDAATGQGVAEVTVQLTLRPAASAATGAAGSPPSPALAPVIDRVITGSDGRFLFRDLPAGAISIFAYAGGYIAGLYGKTTPSGPPLTYDLADGERDGALRIKMWKFASISGTIVDEAGEPAVGVVIRVLRKSVSEGRLYFADGYQSTTTDDRGWFRIGAITPGDYLVSIPNTTTTMPSATVDAYLQQTAAGSSSVDALRVSLQGSGVRPPSPSGFRLGDSTVQAPMQPSLRVTAGGSGAGDRVFAYPATYYPGSPTPAQATAITLGSGEDRTGIDFQLRPVATFRISGVANGPDGPAANLGVKLVPDASPSLTAESNFEAATTVTAADGSFVLLGATPGSYLIKVLQVPQRAPTAPSVTQAASMPTLWANAPVTLSDKDVSGVSLTLRPGSHVSGHLRFDGTAPVPAPDRLAAMIISLSGLGLTGAMWPPPANLTPAGEFTTAGYVPGRYYLQTPMVGGPWIAKSAMLDGRDLLRLPIEIADSDVSGVVVTYTDQAGQIAGSVTTPGGPYEQPTLVMLLAADYRSTLAAGASSIHVFRLASVKKNGTYAFPALLDGDYLILAIPDFDPSTAPDVVLMDAVARLATRITVGEGEKKTMDLVAVKVPR
jgi:hypothetical protein